MGSSSSKQKISLSTSKESGSCLASPKRHSDGNIKPEYTKQAKGKKNKKIKNVKIQDENSNDRDDGGASPTVKIQKSISFGETDKIKLSTPPVYRKKSMCHPLDAKDLNFEELRTRSGSDKSLRFSDFNKLIRQTTLYAWEMAPAEIPLYDVPAPRLQTVCYICGVYTGSVTRACRVCYQVYHDGCLAKVGHALDKKGRQLTEANVWSCHQCSLLSHMLTREDVQEILSDLKDLKMDPDGVTLNDYLKYYESKILGPVEKSSADGFEGACEARFKAIDESSTGYIEFEQFLDLVAVQVLHKRSQWSLVHILTEPELSKARLLFQDLEQKCKGHVTVEAAYCAIKEFDKNIKDFYRPIEDCVANSDEEKRSLISWGAFLCTIAIHFLVQRTNYCLTDSVMNSGDKTQSSESLDETYKSCCSELDSSLARIIDGNQRSEQQVESENKPRSPSLLDEISPALPFNSGEKIQAIGVKEENLLPVGGMQKVDEEEDSMNTEEGHLWTRKTSAYRTHPNFSQHVISFTKGDSNEVTEKTITVLDTTDENNERGGSSLTSRGAQRRSEVLIRPENQDKGQKRRAVSQKVVAPSFGRLVDRVQQEDWC